MSLPTLTIPMTGRKFGKWTVLAKAHDKDVWGKKKWYCQCDCGTLRSVSGKMMRRGRSLSCGCTNYRRPRTSIKHTKGYKIWEGMKARCYNPKNKDFKYYGARGIFICEKWLNARNFVEDMGQPPKKLTIERINNDDGYHPGNCKWATRSEQNRNRRPNLKK